MTEHGVFGKPGPACLKKLFTDHGRNYGFMEMTFQNS